MQGKKGFTLVELLAAIVILGIIMMISIPAVSRWIDKSKKESTEGQKNTLVMATQSYAQGNSEVLPKVIGQTTTVTAEELKKSNYLKEDLINADKKSCMQSFVRIYKYDKNGYTYTAYIYCDGDVVPANTVAVQPTISISFSGDNKIDNRIQDVSVSSFKVVITGGTSGSVAYKLDGYSYTISARYSGNNNDNVIEIFNSGSINAGGRESIVIEKSLSDYTDITKVNDFIITVEAYNRDGGYLKRTATSTYRDATPPICGTITGQAKHEEDYLIRKGDKRTISITCSDGDGSGCVKDKYTKTFDTEMEFGTITISDNAGNTTDCRVRVNIDWTAPNFTATAYKYTGNLNTLGDKVSNPLTVSASSANHTVTMTSNYTGTVNGWLNRATYPKGIEYVIETDDNIRLKDGKLYYNIGGIWSESNNQYDNLKAGETKNFSLTDKGFRFKIEEEGLRKAKYVVRDKAGHSVTMYFIAKIDRTNPTCRETSRGNIGSTSGVSITISCSDGESKCWNSEINGYKNKLSYSNQTANPSTYTVKDYAGNSGSCSSNISSYSCHCSDCYYGENTCRYGCGTCGGFTYMSVCSAYGSSCTATVTNWGTNCSCKCNCSSCYYGHNTCRYGCDTCYK